MWEGDGDILRDGSEENGSVRSECEESKGTACEDGDRDIDWSSECEEGEGSACEDGDTVIDR